MLPEAVEQTNLRNAVKLLSDKLQIALIHPRPNQRGRKSDLGGELYVKGAAEALGITVTHMSRIITGRSKPGMNLACRIAAFTGCSLEEILNVSTARKSLNCLTIIPTER